MSKPLKKKDIEKLENTSIASSLAGLGAGAEFVDAEENSGGCCTNISCIGISCIETSNCEEDSNCSSGSVCNEGSDCVANSVCEKDSVCGSASCWQDSQNGGALGARGFGNLADAMAKAVE